MTNNTIILHESQHRNGLNGNRLLKKRTISELSDTELAGIEGGTGFPCATLFVTAIVNGTLNDYFSLFNGQR